MDVVNLSHTYIHILTMAAEKLEQHGSEHHSWTALAEFIEMTRAFAVGTSTGRSPFASPFHGVIQANLQGLSSPGLRCIHSEY